MIGRLLCSIGLHRSGWRFVGTSWTPDAYVRACVRCGQETTR